jgi:hypothetical protein
MTVATATNKVVIPGNGLTTVFSYNFRVDTATDMQVIYTNALGVSTTISTSLYSISGLGLPGGGTVTYPLVGSPIASGTSLTIARILPLTQSVSISNQGAFYPESVELAIDRAVMETQQISEEMGRAIVGSITDVAPMTPLPPAVQRAGKMLLFDSSGDPMVGTIAPAGTISSAMQPVVSAATLAAGRLAFGLGAVAAEGIGRGLQDDGAGNLRANVHETTKSANYNIAATDHLEAFAVSAAATFTLPATSALWNGFGFWVMANGGTVTLTPNAADSIETNVTGVSSYVPINSKAWVSTNGAGVWKIFRTRTTSSATPPGGYLSLLSGVITPIEDVIAATTIYYNPDIHSTVPIYNGSEWIDYPFSTLSCALNASVQLADTAHDVFVTLISGVPTLVIGPAWRQTGYGGGSGGFTSLTNANPIVCTAASHGLVNGDEVYFTGVQGNEAANGMSVVSGVAGSAFTLTGRVGSGAYEPGSGTFSSRGNGSSTTQLAKLGGFNTNAVQITAYNGVTPYTVDAGKGLYLGTILIDATAGRLTCHRDAGQSRKWGVWNAYNRKNIFMSVTDPTVSWTVPTSTGWRVSRADLTNVCVALVGLPEETIDADFNNLVSVTNVGYVGIGYASQYVSSGVDGKPVTTSSSTVVSRFKSTPTIGTVSIFTMEAAWLAAMTVTGGIFSHNMYVSYRG